MAIFLEGFAAEEPVAAGAAAGAKAAAIEELAVAVSEANVAEVVTASQGAWLLAF